MLISFSRFVRNCSTHKNWKMFCSKYVQRLCLPYIRCRISAQGCVWQALDSRSASSYDKIRKYDRFFHDHIYAAVLFSSLYYFSQSRPSFKVSLMVSHKPQVRNISSGRTCSRYGNFAVWFLHGVQGSAFPLSVSFFTPLRPFLQDGIPFSTNLEKICLNLVFKISCKYNVVVSLQLLNHGPTMPASINPTKVCELCIATDKAAGKWVFLNLWNVMS